MRHVLRTSPIWIGVSQAGPTKESMLLSQSSVLSSAIISVLLKLTDVLEVFFTTTLTVRSVHCALSTINPGGSRSGSRGKMLISLVVSSGIFPRSSNVFPGLILTVRGLCSLTALRLNKPLSMMSAALLSLRALSVAGSSVNGGPLPLTDDRLTGCPSWTAPPRLSWDLEDSCNPSRCVPQTPRN